MTATEARKLSCNFSNKDLTKYNIIENILNRIEEISYNGGDYYTSAYYLSGYRIIKDIMESLGYKVTKLREENSYLKFKTIIYYKISW